MQIRYSLSMSRLSVVVLLAMVLSMTALVSAQSNVVNGDFSAGNSGFSSQYGYQLDLNPEGYYYVTDNPHNCHTAFANMGDHTTGSGLMMVVNGAPSTSQFVWRGTTSVALIVGQTYNFSAWVTNVTPAAPARLTFDADGVTIATLSPGGNASWQRLVGSFTALNANPVLTLWNSQSIAAGNDFAIDDISVKLASTVDLTSAPDPSSVGQNVTLTATLSPSGATGTVTFYDGGTNLGSAAVIGGVATLNTSAIAIGNRTLTAEYSGDGTYDPSSDTDPHTVLNLPEIDVQRPAGSTIADGGSNNVGDQPAGPITLDYTVCNLQGAQLTIPSGGVTASNLVNCSGFSVLTVLPLNIAAGNCTTLQIALNVTDHGPFSFDMDIANNDPDENPYDIAVNGMGLAPEINVQRPAGTNKLDGSIDPMGDLLIGCGRTLVYTIQNTGNAQLDITSANAFNLVNVSGYTVVTPLPLHVAAGSSAALTVTCCLDVPGPFNFDIDIISNDVDEAQYDVDPEGTAWPPPEAIFYATPTMGCPGTVVYFENHSKGMTNSWLWDFGDGVTSTQRSPSHQYLDPGQYTVSLISANPAAADTLVKLELIWIYGYGPINWSPLALVDNSFAFPNESWDNAIDGDVSGWKGTATVEGTPPYVENGNHPFAVFEFLDQTVKPINAVRMLTDTDVGHGERWVSNFHVMVSTAGIADADFATVLTGVKVGGDWQEFTFPQVQAKYIKLVVDKPTSGWRQIGEFQVCPVQKRIDPARSTMVATSPHIANGVDQSVITMTIRDTDGNLVTGLQDEDFCIWANPEPNIYFPVIETSSPGVYATQLATVYGGEKIFGASVLGVPLGTVPIVFRASDITKAVLEFVEGSETSSGEPWDNAIDGVIAGWDGTVTAGGSQCYAIFKFADGSIKALQELYLLVDTGVGYERRWVKRFRLLASTTGLQDTDFSLVYEGVQTSGDWQSHVFPAANAKYIKLIVDFPASGWRQVGELQVYTTDALVAQNNALPAQESASVREIPVEFTVGNNYPNPFNPSTHVDFSLPESSPVEAAIFNALGQKVRTLLDTPLNAGWHSLTWDGTSDAAQTMPSGLYFFQIRAGKNTVIRKIQLLK
jgi:PKD repeat protein